MIRFALPQFVLFLTLLPTSFAADDHSASPPAAPTPLHQNASPKFVVVTVALVCSFLFVSSFAFCLRMCSGAYVTTVIPVRTAVDCSTYGSRGIDRKILDTFPIMVYSTIKDLKIGKEALECAICLSEFKDHETLRLLPNCSHVFHPDCIDAWLASHVTCPVCRANLKPDRRSENEIAIAIPSETNAHNVFGESSVSRSEVNTNSAVETEQAVLSPNYANEEQGGRKNFVNLARSHSTGHSLCEGRKNMERYTLRLPEEVRKQILENHEGIRRSASYDVFCREKFQTRRLQLVLSMTPPFVSRSNAMNP